MTSNKAYKLRIYPTKAQAEMLKQIGGNCRWLWNKLLADNQSHYEQTKTFFFYKDMSASLPKMKQEITWLGEAPAVSLQRVARNLDQALKQCFKSGKGFPRFKKKSANKDSFYITNQQFGIKGNKVKIPKVGWVKFRAGCVPVERILSATISQDGDYWYCSVMCEYETATPVEPTDAIGIDLGLTSLITTSDGEVVDNPRHLHKAENKLKRRQRQLSRAENKRKKLERRKRTSNNYRKKQLKLYRLHRKVRNQRNDFLHKLTTELIANNSVICLEDLNIKGLQRTRLAKSISDVAWGELVRQLTYKAEWYGKHIVKIERFEPSSQICSCCGHRQKMSLDKRTYECPSCGMSMDRDLNAAINIRNWGLDKVGRGTPEPTDASQSTPVDDTSTGSKSLAA